MIILFGVVGSGKSEQAQRLVEKLGCAHLSTSQLLKGRGKREWQDLMLAGKLIPDQDIFDILEPELAKMGTEKEFILDGAPRSVAQAAWLVNKIKAGQLKLTAIIYLVVSKETTLVRLLNRGRDDDTEEVISERFKQYENVTQPVADYLKEQGCEIHKVDGEWSAEMVERQIWRILEGKVEAQNR